jgi:hypothetical protein
MMLFRQYNLLNRTIESSGRGLQSVQLLLTGGKRHDVGQSHGYRLGHIVLGQFPMSTIETVQCSGICISYSPVVFTT